MGNCGWKVAPLSGWHLAPWRAQPLEPKRLGLKPSFLPCSCVTLGALTLLCLSVPFCQISILTSSLLSPGPSECSLIIDDQMNTFSHGCFVIVVMQNVIYGFKEALHMVGIIKGVLRYCHVSCQKNFHCPLQRPLQGVRARPWAAFFQVWHLASWLTLQMDGSIDVASGSKLAFVLSLSFC